MLLLDLTRLRREGRVRIDVDVPPGDPFWDGTDLTPRSPLQVRLEAQQAGSDVVVRGRLAGEFELECRRCLEPVAAELDEDVAWLYGAGETVGAGEAEDVLPLPSHGDIDVTGPVREQVVLGVPRYKACRPDCRGLCPRCGINRNEGTCECTSEAMDERWAPLRRLMGDE